MTRLTQEETEALLALVIYSYATGIVSFNAAVNPFIRRVRDLTHQMNPEGNLTREEVQGVQMRMQYSGVGPDLTYKEVFIHLLEAAAPPDEDRGYQDAALIDRLVDIFCSPYARTALAGETLQEVRNILLLPTEAHRAEEVAEKDNYCTVCGRKFQQREMVIFGGHGQFLCSQCTTPLYRACPTTGCEHVVNIGQLPQVQPCGTCRRGGQPAPPEGELTEELLREAVRRTQRIQWDGGVDPRMAPPVRPIEPMDLNDIYDDLDEEDPDEDL